MINFVNTDPQLRNAPVGLTPEQVADPYLIIDSFFDFADYLPKYRKRLKKWLIAAIDGKHQWTRISWSGVFIVSGILQNFWMRYGSFTREAIPLARKIWH